MACFSNDKGPLNGRHFAAVMLISVWRPRNGVKQKMRTTSNESKGNVERGPNESKGNLTRGWITCKSKMMLCKGKSTIFKCKWTALLIGFRPNANCHFLRCFFCFLVPDIRNTKSVMLATKTLNSSTRSWKYFRLVFERDLHTTVHAIFRKKIDSVAYRLFWS